jgi:ATP-dependent DNA helicase RecQ
LLRYSESFAMVESLAIPSTQVTHAPQAVLRQVFGYEQFRPWQAEIIANVLQRRDTLVIMPTGGGKSLCYQLPALLFEGLTVVVSPLIALMHDQVAQLRQLGVAAVYLNSSLEPAAYGATVQQIRQGAVKLLYVAPETLLRPDVLTLLSDSQLTLMAIDEAHCISQWGHDFRPEYRQLVAVRRRFPQAVCLALTATATPRVQADIKTSLGFRAEDEFITSFDRPNLSIAVTPKSHTLRQTLAFLASHAGQSGILYCNTQRQVDELHAALVENGINALPYHAGLDSATRRRNQEAFLRDDTPVMVATVAFGMGIDKPDVRFVLHVDLPKDIESYYQQIGRAGRDGLPADCLLLYSYSDVHTIRHFIDQGAASEREERLQRLQTFVRWAESDECRRRALLAYFGDHYPPDNCQSCDNCLASEQERVDLTVPAQKFLSCVARTRELFGINHIIQVLRGSQAREVLQRGHDQLSTYGIGQEFSTEQWKHLARQFLQQGLLEQDLKFGSLKLTPKARAVFKGEPIWGTLAARASGGPTAETTTYDAALFAQLRTHRKRLADQSGVPPYVIFPDVTLQEMATYFPHSPATFATLQGVGQQKLARYADEFLPIIVAYCEANGLTERPKAGAEAPRRLRVGKTKTEEVGEAFAAGQSIAELMAAHAVKRQTIITHLDKYVQAGQPLPVAALRAESTLADKDQARVLAAFAEQGSDFLRPVYDALGGEISYDELHLLRIVFRLEMESAISA